MTVNPTPHSSTVNAWTDRASVLRLPNLESFDQLEFLDQCVTVASEILFVLSGKQWAGACSVADARPTRQVHRFDGPVSSSVEGGYTGNWTNDTYQRPLYLTHNYHPVYSSAGATYLPVVWLGDYPLISVQEVRINGNVLDASAYEIHDWSRLVRVDGDGWPTVQDLRAPSSAPNTFGIDYTWGFDPPAMGVMAATRLAGELALSQSPNANKSQLPKRVQTITRQQMSAVLLDPFAMLDEGRTGIYEVDLFLSAVNPGKLREQPAFVTPDINPTTVNKTWRS